mgnify:CR=1 FL=1
MLNLKHIASYFLLLVYGVSFGHQIIPHHHHEENQDHQSESHKHCAVEVETHSHVAHDDHFDEGFIDYLACVFGNHEHNPSRECEIVEGPNDQKNNAKYNPSGLETGSYYSSQTGGEYLIARNTSGFLYIETRQNLIADLLAKRGPPVI